MKRRILPTGKLDVEILHKLLKKYSRCDERVIMGPRIGEDSAAIDMGDRVLVVATDPITFATGEIGYYSVMVNANDVATTGAEPRWYSVVILLPEREDNESILDDIFQQIHAACDSLKISLIGGHTEVSYDLDRPIIVGQMMGEVQKERLIQTAGAKPGDFILMSKGLCVEGTSLIAREKEKDLRSLGISEKLVERARRFLFDPGISVVEEARLASQAAKVHSMHDITEGGLANGLYEIAMAAKVELEIDLDRVPIYDETRILCDAFELNPLGVIASGSLLITAQPPEAERIIEKARQHSVDMTRIGLVRSAGSQSVMMITPGGCNPAPYFERDEVTKLF